MKKLKGWKKILFIILTVIIVLRIGYIAFRGEVDKQYKTSSTYELNNATQISCMGALQTFTSDGERLQSLEVVFDNIAEDKAGEVVLSILSGDELLYRTNISLSNVNNREWKKVFVNAEMIAGKEYTLCFEPSETCTQIPDLLVVKKGDSAPEIASSYSNGEKINGNIAVGYGYLQSPTVCDRLVMISLYLFLWLALSFVLMKFECISEMVSKVTGYLEKQVKLQVLVTVSEVLACMIIMNSSGIEFREPTKVVLYLVSLIAALGYPEKQSYLSTNIDSLWKKVLLYLLYLYAAFALVGQRIFIYPLTVKLTAAGFFVFAVTVLWFVPVVNSLIYYMDKVTGFAFCQKGQMKRWQFVLMAISILLLPAAYNLYANNPGISSPDTVHCMITNAQDLHGMYDWHPAFYCMILRLIQEVWNSTYAVIFVQYFFWAYVMTELMLYLRKKGIRDSILIAALVFSGFNAANYIHLNTIWKDIPYTLSLVWAMILVAKLSIDYEEYKSKWYIYAELIVAFVGMWFFRKNGMVPYILIAIPLVIVLRKNIKLIVSLAISFVLIITIKGPVYDYFEVEDPGRRGMYIGLGQDILGVYYAGGEVSEDTLQMITVMTDYNNAEYEYTPTWAYQSYELDVEMGEFIRNYIDTFIKNPVTMVRAVIAREDALWNIYRGQDAVLGCVNYTRTMDGRSDLSEWNEAYPERVYVSLYPLAASASAYSADSQWISAIVWRGGLFTLLGVLAFAFLLLKKGRGKYLLIITPAIGHTMGLLLSTGWSDFRYYWPLNLLNFGLILLAIVIVGKNEMRETE